MKGSKEASAHQITETRHQGLSQPQRQWTTEIEVVEASAIGACLGLVYGNIFYEEVEVASACAKP